MEFVQLWTIFVLFLPINCIGIRRYSSDLLENDYCGFDTSVYSGKCKKIKKCVNLLVERKAIEICSFDGQAGDETLVCCSRDDFYKSRLFNREGPLDYDTCLDKYKHLRNFESEEFSKFTVNGVEVHDGEFPHMVAIGWLRWYDFAVDWNCGGSLITETFVLTASHCTSFDGRKPNVVRMGDIDLTSPLDDFYVQQYEILNITTHPSYQHSENNNDIALIQFNGQIV
jgi:Trypsin